VHNRRILRFPRPLMDMDFAIRLPARPGRWRLVSGFLFIGSHLLFHAFLQTPPRGDSPLRFAKPFTSIRLGRGTFTSELLSMPGTQRKRLRRKEVAAWP